MNAYFQIGTSEPYGCIGSRAAKSSDLIEALKECRERSRNRSIREAWLRPVIDGQLGPTIASFVKGEREC